MGSRSTKRRCVHTYVHTYVRSLAAPIIGSRVLGRHSVGILYAYVHVYVLVFVFCRSQFLQFCIISCTVELG